MQKGGTIIISIPFNMRMKHSIKRASLENGKVIHLLEPAYHGNPIDQENGSLIFYDYDYDYGWDFISMLKKAGY